MILQQPIQVRQSLDRHLRLAEPHVRTGGPIQHPRRHDDRHAGLTFDDDHVPAGALFAVIAADAAPVERMPAVVNLHLMPDMGRMTLRLRWAARTTFSPAPMAAPSTGRCWPR